MVSCAMTILDPLLAFLYLPEPQAVMMKSKALVDKFLTFDSFRVTSIIFSSTIVIVFVARDLFSRLCYRKNSSAERKELFKNYWFLRHLFVKPVCSRCLVMFLSLIGAFLALDQWYFSVYCSACYPFETLRWNPSDLLSCVFAYWLNQLKKLPFGMYRICKMIDRPSLSSSSLFK